MRLVAVSSIRENVFLAESVWNSKGHILLKAGAELTPPIVKRLCSLGISYVYIEDARTDDIFIRPVLKEETRRAVLSVMSETFDQLKKDLSADSVKFGFHKMEKQFTTVVRDIISQIRRRKEAIDLLTHLHVHDNYIFNHSLNVTIYTLALSMKLKNLTAKQTEEIGLGAMLHDVGKMLIPALILKKPDKLTKDEFEVMKSHTELGFELLRKEHGLPLTAAHCALQHHERLDGSGYPRGLKGNEIHVFGKMIGIADVYDAVTSNRIYRKAMLPHEGMEILYAGSGIEFETDYIEKFRKAIVMYPTGLTVWLTDGRKGIVSEQNEHVSDRPILLILEEDGYNLDVPYKVNLAAETTVFIKETDTTLSNT
ncbi:HD-GYP domain-containing protein [Domibacillus robiginosus]|uniref:HD-GYP domain-containing protein n=1 Tax=Domibacillus robiginosus TaxID=1071054 RepID=UPI00067BF6F3|nr:HD-GYP domain-containing protein [Domibacillus robiginosus]